MTPATKSPDASSVRTRAYETVVTAPGVAADATSVSNCVVFKFEDHANLREDAPARHKSIRELVENWNTNEPRGAALQQARKWFTDAFHSEDGDTVRTLRLQNGWSQTQLAARLGTSQPHVARIERGTENLAIETCRRLCSVLSVDMNTLDEALRRQEVLARAKAKDRQ